MSRYPAELDNDADLPPVVDNITEIGAEAINALRDSVFALESAIGIEPQGSLLNLSDRLSRTLNDDGTWKAASLTAAGLIALPITNSMIGASAAIEESKLDLDVPTLTLQGNINSNDIDILSLQDSIATDINNLSQHIIGMYGRHDGYQIDISGLTGQVAIVTVEGALGFIYDTFLVHRAATVSIQHNASAISYVPVASSPLTATTVQGAISQIDDAFVEDFRKHRDSAHSDGVSKDGYIYLNNQAAINDASLRLGRYISSSGRNIPKLGLINASVIKGIGFVPTDISSIADAITITAKNGINSRTITITGLSTTSADFPSGTSPRFKLKGIVNYLNIQFNNTVNNFPVTAFESDDGELVLQHNIARTDCTITLESPANSALAALGMSTMDAVEAGRVDNYQYIINGRDYSELKLISSGSIVHAGGSSVDLGITTGVGGLELNTDSLFHIFNHGTAAVNGTYKITSVSGTSIGLAASVAAGTFNYVIYEDTIQVPSGGFEKVLEFFIDENRDTSYSSRGTFGSAPVYTGIKIIEISKGIDSGIATLSFTAPTGSSRGLQLTINSISGQLVTLGIGYVGYVNVFGPDNISFITVLIFDPSASLGAGTFTIIDPIDQDNNLYLATSHYDASSVLELPFSHRNVGNVGIQSIGTEFIEQVIERDITNLHISGALKGLNIEATTATTVTIAGGAAYIDGKYISSNRIVITAGNSISGTGTFNLLLSKSGNYEIFNDTTIGYSFADIIAGDQYIAIAQIIVSSGSITGTIDGRIFLNDIELKLQLTVDERQLGVGSFRTLEAAQLYSSNSPNDTKPEISVFSDLTISNPLIIDSNTKIILFQNLILNASLTITANSSVEIFGDVTATTPSSSITLTSASKLLLHGNSTFSTAFTSINIGTDCELITNGPMAARRILISGDNAVVRSDGPKATLTFDAQASGILISSSDGARFDNLDLVMTTTGTARAIIQFSLMTNMYVNNCKFSSSTILTTTEISSVTRTGIAAVADPASGCHVENCEFTNLGSGINISGTLDNLLVENCDFNNIGTGVQLDTSYEFIIENSRFTNLHSYGIRFVGTAGSVRYGVLSSCLFADRYDVISLPIPISATNSISSCIIVGNTFHTFNTTQIIVLKNDVTFEPLNIAKNNIYGCTTSGFAISILGSNGICLLSENIIKGHSGALLEADDISMSNNIFDSIVANGAGSGDIDLDYDGGAPEFIISNNQISMPTTARFEITTSATQDNSIIISNNNITCDALQLTNGSSGDLFATISGNYLQTLGGASNGLELNDSNATTASIFNVSQNTIDCAGVIALRISDGNYTISSNYILASNRGVFIAPPNSSSINNSFNISDNTIRCTSGDYGIFIDGNHALVTGNIIRGIISNDAIASNSSIEDIYISDNFVGAGGAGGSSIRSLTSGPVEVFIGPNKNAISPISYDTMSGYIDSGWVRIAQVLDSGDSSSKRILIPLNGLPIGAYIVDVNVYVLANGVSTIVSSLYRRSGSYSTTPVIGATDSSTGATTEILILAATAGDEKIREDESYIVEIISTSISQRIYQIIVNVRY